MKSLSMVRQTLLVLFVCHVIIGFNHVQCINSQNNTLSQKLTELRTKLTGLKNNITTLKNKLGNLKAKLSSASTLATPPRRKLPSVPQSRNLPKPPPAPATPPPTPPQKKAQKTPGAKLARVKAAATKAAQTALNAGKTQQEIVNAATQAALDAGANPERAPKIAQQVINEIAKPQQEIASKAGKPTSTNPADMLAAQLAQMRRDISGDDDWDTGREATKTGTTQPTKTPASPAPSSVKTPPPPPPLTAGKIPPPPPQGGKKPPVKSPERIKAQEAKGLDLAEIKIKAAAKQVATVAATAGQTQQDILVAATQAAIAAGAEQKQAEKIATQVINEIGKAQKIVIPNAAELTPLGMADMMAGKLDQMRIDIKPVAEDEIKNAAQDAAAAAINAHKSEADILADALAAAQKTAAGTAFTPKQIENIAQEAVEAAKEW